MEKTVITAGNTYIDLDALASAIAYQELLTNKGQKAVAVLPQTFNKSITKTVKNWDINYKTEPPKENVSYVIVDLSNPKYFADFVKEEKITEIYDHHSGFKKYWKKHLGKKAIIEPIGACATLIWEQFKKHNIEQTVSTTSANLLYAAIISNTLNLNASVTNKRDKKALGKLKNYINLPTNWIEQYFKEQEIAVLKNPQKEIVNDTKIVDISGKQTVIGQLELWHSRQFIQEHKKDIYKAMESFKNPRWFFTSPSISEGKNYLLTEDKELVDLLAETIGAEFSNEFGVTDRLWLRKEILIARDKSRYSSKEAE